MAIRSRSHFPLQFTNGAVEGVRLNKATEPDSCSKGVCTQQLSRQASKYPLTLQAVTIWGWNWEGARVQRVPRQLGRASSLLRPRLPASVRCRAGRRAEPGLQPEAARARLAGGRSRAQRRYCLRVSQVHTGPGLAWQPGNLFQSRQPSPHMPPPPPPEPGARAYPMMHRASPIPSGPPCCRSER